MRIPSGQSLALGTLFVLPALNGEFFGWLIGLLAVPVMLLLLLHGRKAGSRQIAAGLIMAGGCSLLMRQADVFAFTLTMVPVGYILAESAVAGDSAAKSGAKGLAVLCLSWLFYWGGFGMLTGINPYASLLQAIDQVLQQTLALYRAPGTEISPEMLFSLEQMTQATRQTIPAVLPGILAVMTIAAVWINLAATNRILARITDTSGPWGRFETWKLPDTLVWIPIGAALLLLSGSGAVKHAGICALMGSGFLYFIQGLAVLLALMNRWNIPVFLRWIIYFICFIQSFSMILLALLGLSETWLPLRPLEKQKD